MSRLDVVLVLLRVTAMPDPGNVLSWLVDGRTPTAAEIRVLHSTTAQEALDLAELLRLDHDVDVAFDRDLGWAP